MVNWFQLPAPVNCRSAASAIGVRGAGADIPSRTASSGPAPKFARHDHARMPPSNTVDQEPELYVTDFSDGPSAAEYRERLERARSEARRRYREHLAEVFERHRVAEPGELADAALDALTVWRYIDSGERCICSCHPRLPDSDLHDYGFDCVCQRTPEDRRRAFDQWRNSMAAFWRSPEGQQINAAEQAAEAELQAWLADQPGVIVHSHGGLTPEQWTGEVDGYSFYFRERHGEWRIELDLRPSGRFARVFAGSDDDGTIRYEEREVDEGDVIADGTTAAEGYGTTPVERAQFITDTIRIHQARQACTHHRGDLSSIEAVLGAQARWCPSCGTRLPER
jgi:hypothetical protein